MELFKLDFFEVLTREAETKGPSHALHELKNFTVHIIFMCEKKR